MVEICVGVCIIDVDDDLGSYFYRIYRDVYLLVYGWFCGCYCVGGVVIVECVCGVYRGNEGW